MRMAICEGVARECRCSNDVSSAHWFRAIWGSIGVVLEDLPKLVLGPELAFYSLVTVTRAAHICGICAALQDVAT